MALFSRPFREHDFYVGVYDALNFSADRLCSTAASPQARSGTEYRARCHVAAFHNLIHRIEVGCTGELLVERMYAVEHGTRVRPADEPDVVCATTDDERRRNAVLVRISEAFRETQGTPRPCKVSYLMSASWRMRAPWAREVVIERKDRMLYRMQCDVFASRFTVGVTTTRLSTRDSNTCR